MRNNDSHVQRSTFTIYSQIACIVNGNGSFMFYAALILIESERGLWHSTGIVGFQYSSQIHNGIFRPKNEFSHKFVWKMD